MYQLGVYNQYRNVDYVRYENGWMYCLLCGTGGMARQAAVMHFNGSKHGQNHAKIKQLEQRHDMILDRYAKMEAAHASVELIRYPTWKSAAKAMLYDGNW